MSKKGLKLGVALAAGAGAAAMLAKNSQENKEIKATKAKKAEAARSDYRNTERGKYEKNSKGIYYTNGNYEAFARPRKPEGVDEKSAYIVGSGLASLAAACFLVRDGQMEGSHIQLGVDLCRKYKESAIVINAVESHHGDVEPESVIAVIVAAADALSSARPGARNESVENYVKRLRDLEEIASSFDGVQTSFALQAGREIRIMVHPNKISDDEVTILSHKVREQIEKNLDYPGNIKVTVIREFRAVDYAK